MARELSKRLTITGTLQATMPLHIGGLPNSIDADMPLAKNGLGELYVPGTSLAGVFRSWMERHFDNQEILKNLWGQVKGAASRIFIEDAKVTLPDGLSEEIWDNIGIDRRWGSAAQSVKFDRTIIPKGSTIDLCLQIDLPLKDTKIMQAMLGYLMKALQAGQIALGAATTRGFGQVKLIKPQLHEIAWTEEGLLQWLADKHRNTVHLDCDKLIKADNILICHGPEILHVTIDWAPVGPLMSKASYDGIEVDTLPKVSGIDGGEMTLVLAGSSLKGALRFQAERIIRTVLGITDLSENWFKQIQVPLVDSIFGAASASRSCLSVSTCYATNINCTSQQWQEIESANYSERSNLLYKALNRAGLRKAPYFEQGFHLGIDRWTGCAAETFLYSAIEPFGVEWAPIEIRLDLDRLPSDLKTSALALLLLLLRDLSEHRLPIGFGVNYGYGELEVRKVSFKWEEAVNKYGLEGDFNDLSKQALQEIQRAWRDWIKALK
jgi:CRISPR/Cas system CSM-associated protein Csm3 (group 7 of RAMP superfamily)